MASGYTPEFCDNLCAALPAIKADMGNTFWTPIPEVVPLSVPSAAVRASNIVASEPESRTWFDSHDRSIRLHRIFGNQRKIFVIPATSRLFIEQRYGFIDADFSTATPFVSNRSECILHILVTAPWFYVCQLAKLINASATLSRQLSVTFIVLSLLTPAQEEVAADFKLLTCTSWATPPHEMLRLEAIDQPLPSWRLLPRADQQSVGMPAGCRTPRDWRRHNRHLAAGNTPAIGVKSITAKTEQARIRQGHAPGRYFAFIQEWHIDTSGSSKSTTRVLGFTDTLKSAASIADANRPLHERNCYSAQGEPIGFAVADNPHHVWFASPHCARPVANSVWADSPVITGRRAEVNFQARQAMVWAHRLHCTVCQATPFVAATHKCYMAFLLHVFIFGFEPIMIGDKWPEPKLNSNRRSLLRGELRDQLIASLHKAAKFPCAIFQEPTPLYIHPLHPVVKPADRDLPNPPVRLCTDAVPSLINDHTLPWVVKLMDKRRIMLHLRPLCIFAKLDFQKFYWQIPVSDFFAQATGHSIPAEFRAALLHRLQQDTPFFEDWSADQLHTAVMVGLSFGMKTGSSVASLISSEFCAASMALCNAMSPQRLVPALQSAYIDDILGITDDSDAQFAMNDYRATRALGRITALRLHCDNDKDVPPLLANGRPRRTIVHDGVMFDSVRCTVSVDKQKRKRVLAMLDKALLPQATKGELLRLVGMLEHLEVVVRGTAILNNFIWHHLHLHGGPPKDAFDKRPAKVEPGSYADRSLQEWSSILRDASFSWSASWLQCDPINARVLPSDAAGNLSDRHKSAGWSAFIGNIRIYERWTAAELEIKDLSLKEGRALLVCTTKLGKFLSGRILVHLVDNAGFSYDTNKQRTMSPARFSLLLSLSRAQRRFNFELVSNWAPREDPRIEWSDNGTRA
jgi:hypothetical protein